LLNCIQYTVAHPAETCLIGAAAMKPRPGDIGIVALLSPATKKELEK
jgi:hypothetical protein